MRRTKNPKVTPLRDKTQRSARVESRAKKIVDLKREVAELRTLQALNIPRESTADAWEALLPQEWRDYFAAHAIIAEHGDPYRALVRLGFAAEPHEASPDLIDRVLKTPGVQALLTQEFAEGESARLAVVSRLVRMSLYGEDDAAVRAASLLAKMLAWQAIPDVAIDKRTLNLYAILGRDGPKAVAPAAVVVDADGEHTLTFLDHEPGAPSRISVDDENVNQAVEAAYDEVEP